MAKIRYAVLSPLKLGGKRYEPGQSVEIPEENTEIIRPLLKEGIIELPPAPPSEPAEPAKAVIEKIQAAETTEQVLELSSDDPRKTVIEAARKRLIELGAKE
jgi:hypothetical protein